MAEKFRGPEISYEKWKALKPKDRNDFQQSMAKYLFSAEFLEVLPERIINNANKVALARSTGIWRILTIIGRCKIRDRANGASLEPIDRKFEKMVRVLMNIDALLNRVSPDSQARATVKQEIGKASNDLSKLERIVWEYIDVDCTEVEKEEILADVLKTK